MVWLTEEILALRRAEPTPSGLALHSLGASLYACAHDTTARGMEQCLSNLTALEPSHSKSTMPYAVPFWPDSSRRRHGCQPRVPWPTSSVYPAIRYYSPMTSSWLRAIRSDRPVQARMLPTPCRT